MADDTMDLRSVNWTHGMFLTPEHFLRQERYFDSLVHWLIRYSTLNHGLIGGGPRVESSEMGAARFDPIVAVDETDTEVKVTVTQCRGLTRGGSVVEIDPSSLLQGTFPKKQLEGVSNFGVYVVALPHSKVADKGVEDPVNPQIQSARRYQYKIRLEVDADEAEWSLLLTRLRRPESGIKFEKIPGFIPPCCFMCSHSELNRAFLQLNEKVMGIADRFSLLHRAIVDFIGVAASRGIDLEQDRETLAFVSRMVVALEDCAYQILNPVVSPQHFFQHMTKLVRSSLLFLTLSPPTKQYFHLLADVGETEFVSILEQGEEALKMDRRWSVHDDLRVEVQKVNRVLDGLDRLERALEGKYLDFRISPTLESINFVFDRTGTEPVLYKSVAKPARPQASGQELTFVFAPLRLEAREVYRIILVGEANSTFTKSDELHCELRINKGEGYSKAEYLTANWEIDDQKNFAVDFKAPDDIITINDVRVSLRSIQPIRSAILYVRARLMTGDARRVEHAAPPRERAAPAPAPDRSYDYERTSRTAAPAPEPRDSRVRSDESSGPPPPRRSRLS